MTDKKDKALKLALEYITQSGFQTGINEVITAIKEAMTEQPAQQQEPVAWMVDVDLANYQGQSEYRTILSWNAKPVWSGTHEINEVLKAVPLYTSPPASKPLTDEQEVEEFEAWCYSVGLMQKSHGIVSISSQSDIAWKAWQARAAHGITGEQK